jgi:hypothetical protein
MDTRMARRGGGEGIRTEGDKEEGDWIACSLVKWTHTLALALEFAFVVN